MVVDGAVRGVEGFVEAGGGLVELLGVFEDAMFIFQRLLLVRLRIDLVDLLDLKFVVVGRVQTVGGQTHNAWYWPAAGYVFVGEESGRPGEVHVVDVSDPSNPVEVATFGVSGASALNFWLDEARGILYVAWYNGLEIRAIDVSGELLGRLDTQGREVGRIAFSDGFTWAPQLHDGLVYVSEYDCAYRPALGC